MKHLRTLLGSVFIAALTASAQVVVNEQFNYADDAALQANWQIGVGLTLDTGAGNPAPSASHPGSGTAANIWIGSTFSLTPTDTDAVRLSADLFSSGNAQQANTIGLRQSGGITPLFEMGMYRLFDNIQTGPGTADPLDPVQDGIGVRTLNVASDLPGQDWVKMGINYSGWARFEATFTELSVTTRIDLGIDGTWDLSYTETGTTPIAPFSQLRIHSPVTSTGGGFGVDNILLEVVPVPEPSTSALMVFGAVALAFLARRKK